jgi:chromosomal replication initiation ATPase DnaA
MGILEFTEEEISAHRLAGETLTFDAAVLRVMERHGIESSRGLLARDRHQHVVRARQELYAILRAQGWSYPSIGRACGGRDHCTIMHALKKDRRKSA